MRMKKHLLCLPLLLAGTLFLAGCSKQLESGLSEYDAQQIIVLLRENGINASLELDPTAKKDAATWIVTVRGRDDTVVRAWKLLEENGLPREKVKGLDSVFQDAGMIPTASQEKARLISGLDGEITRTLDSLPDVADARVQVVLPENTPLLDKSQQAQPTASVLLQYRSQEPPLKEAEIKSLVARSVEGLAPDNVAVVYKKVAVQPIPVQVLGPLSFSQWMEIGAAILAVVAAILSLLVISVSKVRKRKIQSLEKQLEELRGGASKQKQIAPAKA
jgi:type III secretion protein J